MAIGASRWRATTFGETMHSDARDSTLFRFRSTVEYQPTMVPVRYSDTRYVLPRRLTTTYVTCVDVGRRRCAEWYQSSVDVEPVTVSNVVVVGGFRRLQVAGKLANMESIPGGDASPENDDVVGESRLETLNRNEDHTECPVNV